nr:hypothetical protein [uncultured Rhodopila sp.]
MMSSEPALPLSQSAITATMTDWMTVETLGHKLLYGFSLWHPRTGGLAWTMSTPVVELAADKSRARTLSGRVYGLGRQISFSDLDEEGQVALRLLASGGPTECPADSDDVAWVASQKMARHLLLPPPPRGDPAAVEDFVRSHRGAYLAIRSNWSRYSR